MSAVPRAELPDQPKNPKHWMWFVRPQAGQRLSFYPLWNELYAVWVHWDPVIKRNFPCLGKDVCPRCGPHSYRIWQGYITGAKWGNKEKFVVEITRGCAQRMKEEGLLSQSLYGMELTLTRKVKEGSKNGAVLLESYTKVPLSKVPQRIDPVPALLRLWAWNEEHAERLRAKVEANNHHAKDALDSGNTLGY